MRRALLLMLPSALLVALVGACYQATDCKCCDVRCDNGRSTPAHAMQEVSVSSVPPLPISGGTLMVTRDGATAIVSDPDRDRVVVVDILTQTVRSVFQTPLRAEPGRSVEDSDGRVHVVLRRTGQVVTLDVQTGVPSATTHVCADARGIAFAPASNRLYVACAAGELVTLQASKKPQLLSAIRLEPDLRDVVVSGERLFVTHFRAAAIDVLDSGGAIEAHSTLSLYLPDGGGKFAPAVAWRAVAAPDGHVVIAHQRARIDSLSLVHDEEDGPGGYVGNGCTTAAVHSSITVLDSKGIAINGDDDGGMSQMTLAVDLAVSASGTRVAIVAAGSQRILEGPLADIIQSDGCADDRPGRTTAALGDAALPIGSGSLRVLPSSPEPIAVAYGALDRVIVQMREPSRLEIHDPATGAIVGRVDLGGESRLDTAHRMFHGNPDSSNAPIACASCHPEGGDDGHTWTFEGVGSRRTQSLRGFSPETAPFHWEGDLPNAGALVDQVFVRRMGGAPQSAARKTALENWMRHIPEAAASTGIDPSAASRGRGMFFDDGVGCAGCHSGSLTTDNVTVDVGTGAAFQVPSLRGVGARAPYMHDGCAPRLMDRFTNVYCGGGDLHGKTSQLSSENLSDLVAYLETL